MVSMKDIPRILTKKSTALPDWLDGGGAVTPECGRPRPT